MSNDSSVEAQPLTAKTIADDDVPELIHVGIDEMLSEYVGEFGPWQMRHFVLTSTVWALEAFHTMVMIFADREDGVGSSTVGEWGLVGKEKYKVGLVQALFFGGCMIGAGIFGHLSDSFLGRKRTLSLVCFLNFIFGIITSFSPTYWAYAALRFLTGISTGGTGLCAFILSTEPIGPTKRGAIGMSTFYSFSAGIVLLAAIAYIFPSWRTLYIVTSIPSLFFLVTVIPFLSESPRWYLVRHRPSEAMQVMRAIASKNNKQLPENLNLVLDNNRDKNNTIAPSASLIDVVQSPLTRIRLVLAIFINFFCSIVYYGLSLNVVNLKTNLNLSVTLNAIAEMPAYTLTALLLDNLGRKPLSIGTMWLSGMACLVGSITPGFGEWKVVRTVCSVIGIFGIAGTYNLLFIYTSELFPTVVRNAALGCATQASQMGAILAPLVVVRGERLSFLFFGVCGIAGGIVGLFLPETMNKPLYDTMAGLEDGEKKTGVSKVV